MKGGGGRKGEWGEGFTGHETVALEVGEAALFEEDICFVEEEDCRQWWVISVWKRS